MPRRTRISISLDHLRALHLAYQPPEAFPVRQTLQGLREQGFGAQDMKRGIGAGRGGGHRQPLADRRAACIDDALLLLRLLRGAMRGVRLAQRRLTDEQVRPLIPVKAHRLVARAVVGLLELKEKSPGPRQAPDAPVVPRLGLWV